ncbi:hypothetical protein [Streptomyces sp. NPDC049906]|uniref:hypothetical protein n=1 Tax=Streptomyces sp. NPDC049906 TaxID=3155656 RepID=UPI0034250006
MGAEPNDGRDGPADRSTGSNAPAGDGAPDGGRTTGPAGAQGPPPTDPPAPGCLGLPVPTPPPTAAGRPTPPNPPGPPAQPPAPGFGPPPGQPPGPTPGEAPAGSLPPPPAAPPAPGSPPPGYGHGYGAPPPAGPPAAPRGEANRAQAAVVGLLNLSCLGLGYLLLRHWVGAVLCWIATAAFLVIALPADVDGVPAGPLIGYGFFLLLAAADGARRGLRADLRLKDAHRRLALPLALVLLAVPAGGSLAYGSAREEAREQALLDRLDGADRLVASAEGLPFDKAQPIYRKALATYRDLGTEHTGSRAGKLVPDRLDAYYEQVSAPYEREAYCDAVAPLTYLRELPRTVDRDLLGTRPDKTDEPLAHSLYECGVAALGLGTAQPAAEKSLNALYDTFPESAHAGKVEPAVRAALGTRTAALKGGGTAPCETVGELRVLRESLGVLRDSAARGVAKDAGAAVQKGDFACGTAQFRNKDFAEAGETMTRYAADYPRSRQAGHARSIAIAAEIAEEEPAAGRKLPPAEEPGGSRMVMVVSNDGPDPVELLYTGPVSGRADLKACADCTTYKESPFLGSKKKIKACKGPSSKYPKTTLLLPAGDYHFLQKTSSTSVLRDTKSSKQKIEPGYSYTFCLYTTSLF